MMERHGLILYAMSIISCVGATERERYSAPHTMRKSCPNSRQ